MSPNLLLLILNVNLLRFQKGNVRRKVTSRGKLTEFQREKVRTIHNQLPIDQEGINWNENLNCKDFMLQSSGHHNDHRHAIRTK